MAELSPSGRGPSGTNGCRTLILGLDGATWDVAGPLMDEGRLPTLARLVAGGARAPLASTMPAMTLPAWSTMLTGCNPGKHGIFDFVRKVPGRWELGFTNSTHRQAPTLHRILSDRGGRVASIAVPTTWPPEPVDGVVVSGFDSPVSTGIDGSFCHPAGLYKELVQRFGGLKFADFQETVIGPGWHDAALAALSKEIPRKRDIARWLLGQERWDCFMLLLGESDTVSHHFWMFHDDGSPRHPAGASAAHRQAIVRIYEELDAAVAEIIDRADPDHVLICSDHGFGGAGSHVLHLNRYLESTGWLRYRRDLHVEGLRSGSSPWDRARALAMRRIPARLQGKLFRAIPDRVLSRLETGSRFGDVDLGHTCAVSDEMNYAATVRLNLPAPERAQAIEDLRGLLLEWEVDGHRPVAAVHAREDIYDGPAVELSPDLVLELALRDGYSYTLLPSARAPRGQTWRRLEAHEHVGGKGLGMNGSHRSHGLMVLWGQGVAAGGEGEAHLADLAPTLLHLMGETIPEHMDGRVLAELLDSSVGPPRRSAWSGGTVEERPTARSEERAIRDRLARLGYL